MNIESLMTDLTDVIVPFGLSVLGAIGILIVGRIAAGLTGRGVRRGLTRANVDQTLIAFFARLVSIVVMAFAVVASLERFGVKTTSFVAVLGAAGFAVGLALQGSLANFAAGVLIIVFRPFKAGDFVEAAGVSGTVRAIHLFTTEIATPDNVQVIAPNRQIFEGTIRNFSGYDKRRVDLTVGIGYGANIGRAIEVVGELIRSDTRTLKDPAPQIVVSELADSSVHLLIRCWTPGAEYWNVRFDLTRQIKEHFDVQGIDIPFPQRVVHMVQS